MGTLETLKEDMRHLKNMAVAKWIVQYQDYNLKAALRNAPEDMQEPTLRAYMSRGIHYMKTGEIREGITKAICKCLDTLLNECKIQPLRPSAEDRKRVYHRVNHRKDRKLPVNKVLIQIKEEAKNSGDFKYGVLLPNDMIQICNSEKDAVTFLKGINFLASMQGKESTGKVVELEIKELK